MEVDINRLLGQKIKFLRKANNITQADLAEKAALSDDFIGRLERGRCSPTIKSLKKISDTFEIPLKDLLDFGEDHFSNREILIKLIRFLHTRSNEDIEMIYNIAVTIIKRFDMGTPPD